MFAFAQNDSAAEQQSQSPWPNVPSLYSRGKIQSNKSADLVQGMGAQSLWLASLGLSILLPYPPYFTKSSGETVRWNDTAAARREGEGGRIPNVCRGRRCRGCAGGVPGRPAGQARVVRRSSNSHHQTQLGECTEKLHCEGDPHRRLGVLQGSSYLLGQRFQACIVLTVATQRGEGEKREGMPISKQRASTQEVPRALYMRPESVE